MFIVMEQGASADLSDRVVGKIEAMRCRGHVLAGAARTSRGVTGNPAPLSPADFETLAGVSSAIAVTQPFKQVRAIAMLVGRAL